MASVPNVTTVSVLEATERYVDLPAIVGGALVATAISLILITFGSALGLSFVSVEPGEGISLRWVAIAGGLWVIWTAVSSSVAGGYFAGRMRKPAGDSGPEEMDTRDGAHGVAVWSLATLVAVFLTAAGVGGAVTGVASAVGGAADTVAEAVAGSSKYLVGVALRNDGALPSEATRKEISSVLIRSLDEGEVSQADRQYLAQLLARESNLTPAEARNRVDTLIANAQQAQKEAIEAAEQARIFALIGAFVIAASLLVSAAAAYFGAALGGKHRNEHIGFARFRADTRRSP